MKALVSTVDIYMQNQKNLDLTGFIKINLKYNMDLNIKHKTIQVQEDDIVENLDDLWWGGGI